MKLWGGKRGAIVRDFFKQPNICWDLSLQMKVGFFHIILKELQDSISQAQIHCYKKSFWLEGSEISEGNGVEGGS